MVETKLQQEMFLQVRDGTHLSDQDLFLNTTQLGTCHLHSKQWDPCCVLTRIPVVLTCIHRNHVHGGQFVTADSDRHITL